jgi:RHS repeat-associated protein
VLWQSYPDGDQVGSVSTPIAYDGAGRQKAIPGIVTAITYDAAGQVLTFQRANGANTTYGYSASRNWLTSVVTTAGATTIQNLVYGRDAAGRISGVTSSIAGESWTYGYDDMDRLLSADNTTNNALDQSWTYDTVGNMLTNSAVGTYTYPAPGSARPHAVTSTPLGSYGYDANGNMISAAGDTITYDGENRPVSVNAVSFAYGPDGERLKKTSGATTTLYLGSDTEIQGGVMTKYLPGDAKRSSTTTWWLHRDHLVSVRALTDATGAVVERSNYKPYGERIVTLGTVPESKGFIGERTDDETGLAYLHARYYDPQLGVFIQPDTWDPRLVGVNRYAYGASNPVMYTDKSGHVPLGNPPGGAEQSRVEVCVGSCDFNDRPWGSDTHMDASIGLHGGFPGAGPATGAGIRGASSGGPADTSGPSTRGASDGPSRGSGSLGWGGQSYDPFTDVDIMGNPLRVWTHNLIQ